MEKELEVARRLAREAGTILMEFYRDGAEVQWKGHDDPVTAADHAANEMLVRELHKHFPQDAILSEELPDDRARLSYDRVWMVDPMDGTKQFIERLDEFAVMIGLAIAGEPKLGVVYNPATDKMYYAAPGMGAFLEEKWTTKRLRVAAETDSAKLVAAMSRSHHSPTVDSIRARLGSTEMIRSGSVGLKMGLIAEGHAHIYIHTGARTNQWDTCGPEAILREAGGEVTDNLGEPLGYNTSEIRNQRGIIATCGAVHEEVVAATKAVLAEQRRK
ncbi:MAG TPA: 3'(2'),5'-bisphosphate nucleotidase CysQ [Blastocatellia bacterium]|nr:3'(2'),5'-bisphosphate nucleotidase CysQ [Blastocatellia bacterium]HMV82889.1 3'(2'),5'-bisphosphate nucleotidase CysQ [Blastocatellia bacterium]HMY75200.1 3'(2'),5'-bisphosphate nucleotidase CysQ [Blastocatellia bacterium]HMZ22252.1 3'(2'),5'-bisphosphate nucleotidase CysQ [Blastocatellia bacterium]HNG29564.1 3'(2'),5'-bisphosphate nucleotidase CysQ [Blastocatellia bacterium]